jgi:hypothetical protein
MARIVKPALGANISSKDWEKFFGKWFPNGIFNGLQVTAGTGLNVNISAGTGHINGYFIESDATETRSVTASTTNYVWCKLTRDASNFVTTWDFSVTTTSTPPSDSFLLATVVTSGTGVTSVTDNRNSGFIGTSLETLPSTSNSLPHLRVKDTSTPTPLLEFVKSDGTSFPLGMRLISITTFTSSGTYTTPATAKLLIVDMCGGGGGGSGGNGGSSTLTGAGGAGGGSGAFEEILIIEPASSYTITIGAGGSGGTGGATNSFGTNGSNGGITFFGNYASAQGLGGTVNTSSLSSTQTGGSGGSANQYALISAFKNGVNGGNTASAGQTNRNDRTFTTYNGGNSGSGGNGGGGGGGGFFGNGGNGGNGATSTTASTAGQSASANSGAGGGGGGGGLPTSYAYTAGANGGNGGSGFVKIWAFG